MKSLRESLGFGRTVSNLECPKSAPGILPHQEEEHLQHLWIDIIKSEEGCRRLIREVPTYQQSIRDVQEAEEKLVKDLGNTGVTAYSPKLREATDEYLSVVMEVKDKSENTSSAIQQCMGEPVKAYHGLYEPLDVVRRRRDAQLLELNKCQDRLDKLKLKLKRTTDVVVERDALLKQLKDLNAQLLQESHKFHSLREPFLKPCIQAYVQSQVDYYGSSASQYNKQIQVSRGAHQLKESEFDTIMTDHLQRIKSLKIVAT